MSLPPEIMELIIDFLGECDKRGFEWKFDSPRNWATQALCACSLTCRALRPRSQFHLFETLHIIEAKHLRTLLRMLPKSTSRIGDVVQTIRIGGPVLPRYPPPVTNNPRIHNIHPNWWIHPALLILPRYTGQPSTLHLVSLPPLHPCIGAHSQSFTSVTRLILRNCHFQTFGQYIRLISVFRSLRELEIINLPWLQEASGHRIFVPKNDRMRGLKLQKLRCVEDLELMPYHMMTDLLRWLLQTKSVDSLRFISWKRLYINDEFDHTLRLFIFSCCSLQTIQFGRISWIYSTDLPDNIIEHRLPYNLRSPHRIRSISFSVSGEVEDIISIRMLLSSLVSKEIGYIDFLFEFEHHEDVSLNESHVRQWGYIDGILSNCSGLQQVSLRFEQATMLVQSDVTSSIERYLSDVEKALRQTSHRGILRSNLSNTPRHFLSLCDNSVKHTISEITEDGRWCAVGCREGKINLWDLSSGRIISTFDGGDDIVALSFSPNMKYLASVSYKGVGIVWDLTDGSRRYRFLNQVRAISWSQSTGTLQVAVISETEEARVRAWIGDAETLDGDYIPINLSNALAEHNHEIYHLLFTPNATTLIISNQVVTHIWNVTEKTVLTIKYRHGEDILAMDVSPDSQRLVIGSLDHTCRILGVQTGEELALIQHHSGPVQAVSFSPNGNTALSSSSDGTILLFDGFTGDIIARLARELAWCRDDEILTAKFAMEGRMIVSGSEHGYVQIWDTSSGSLHLQLNGHKDLVLSAIVTREGDKIVSASFDRVINIWCLNYFLSVY
ncbi:quinon protein alcohol dehydrogenase-like superfamily [Abortiporus biennis]|nr:quinon protein alcohol dehydrogenase-like superfamily [Abortiporus biennis]